MEGQIQIPQRAGNSIAKRASLMLAAVLVTNVVVPALSTQKVIARDVPVIFSQHSAPWGNHYLGNGRYTISNAGCALTSYTMVRDSYGAGMNPLSMNNALVRQGNAFWHSDINFGNLPGFIGSKDYSRTAADLNFINWALDRGYSVIAETYFPPSRSVTHFVVITGHNGYSYSIADPWFGDRADFGARYGSPSRWIYGVWLYRD